MLKERQGDAQEAANRAAAYFGNGFHCAEAVAAAVLETLGQDARQATAHATAFGAGFARTFQEACGALSGGLIAIGHLYGRSEPGGDWDLPAELGEDLYTHFLHDHQTAHCETLRRRFGEEAQMDECRKLVSATAAYLVRLLSEDGTGPESKNG